MIIKKPSIYIYTYQADSAILKEVCAGIEEEGVFYDIFQKSDHVVEQLAVQAASDSMLGSGIGIFGHEVCLKMRGLENGRSIERYVHPTKNQCRNLGANSARIIKKLPLKETYFAEMN